MEQNQLAQEDCQMVDLESSNRAGQPHGANGGGRHQPRDDVIDAGSSTSSTTAASTDNAGGSRGRRRPWTTAYQKALLPGPVVRLFDKSRAWVNGPDPPRPFRIKPFFEPVQKSPVVLLRTLVPKKTLRGCIAIVVYILWLVGFIAVITRFSPKDILDYGSSPTKLSCTTRLWPSAPYCGPDGEYCRPFDNYTIAFNCPAECQRVQVLNPYTIGAEQVVYRTLVIGGGPSEGTSDTSIYRGDSFICAAAVHAGAISGDWGGCGVMSLTGKSPAFEAVDRNGISSIGFNSSFPLSYTFLDVDAASQDASCQDPQWRLFPLSVVFTVLISLFTTSPLGFFAPIFAIIFFQVALASDAPSFSDYYSAASTAIGRFLPAALVAVLIYRYVVRDTLRKLTAQFEKTILWVGACWVGAIENYTLNEIPIQRLNAHDLRQQPGAIAALVVIVILLLIIAVGQIWALRREGRLPRYLVFYSGVIVALLLLLAIPGLNLRIHHYILALLLLPGTKIQTRPSLLYQGLLVGLFINGTARWGFDSILQTSAALQGDAQLGSVLPEIATPILGENNITFSWDGYTGGYTGISILVNDVERFHAFQDDGQTSFTWTRQASGFDEYFRFGFIGYTSFSGLLYGDYTKAGTWDTNGTWVPMETGSS